ncbi:MAG: Sua5/YciO/YrdC/YwlC family protein, partial [Kiritimatiellae bacterium]|nr:Sua5/YciO/YrdC/YwlC family protein [Kiritimatiellia bacterium]
MKAVWGGEELPANVKLNPDADFVAKLKSALEARDGHCPCRLQRIPENKCPCAEFRGQMADPGFSGFCHCRLYWKDKPPKTVRCDDAGLAETAAALNAGGVAVIPTDTVYGLAAHPKFPAAVERLYAIKGREAKKPIALLAADAAAAEAFVGGFSPAARALAARWPGALTLVTKGEGLRVPGHAWTRRLLAACGGVLRVTSANLSGRRPATDAPAALAEVGLSADVVVDDGTSPGGVPSTVVKVDEDGSR